MIATSFDESNEVLGRPPGMTGEQCDPLSVRRGFNEGDGLPLVVSCWKPTKEELEEINRTGRMWLVVCGVTMPPVVLMGHKPRMPGER